MHMKLVLILAGGLTHGVAVASPDTVEAAYNQYCFACHGTGVGPMKGDAKQWQSRLEARAGMEGLLSSAKAGLNAMPPMGSCMGCTDAQLRELIEFMVGGQ